MNSPLHRYLMLVSVVALIIGGFFLNDLVMLDVLCMKFNTMIVTDQALSTYLDIPVLTLRGNPYEMGLIHGKNLKKDIKLMIAEMKVYFKEQKEVLREFSIKDFRKDAAQYLPNMPQELVHEMTGIAEGANVSVYDIFLLNVFLEYYNILDSYNYQLSDIIDQTDMVNEKQLNSKLFELLENNKIIIDRQPEKGLRVVNLSWPGIVGVLDGINSKGIILSSRTNKSEYRSFNQIYVDKLLVIH